MKALLLFKVILFHFHLIQHQRRWGITISTDTAVELILTLCFGQSLCLSVWCSALIIARSSLPCQYKANISNCKSFKTHLPSQIIVKKLIINSLRTMVRVNPWVHILRRVRSYRTRGTRVHSILVRPYWVYTCTSCTVWTYTSQYVRLVVWAMAKCSRSGRKNVATCPTTLSVIDVSST